MGSHDLTDSAAKARPGFHLGDELTRGRNVEFGFFQRDFGRGEPAPESSKHTVLQRVLRVTPFGAKNDALCLVKKRREDIGNVDLTGEVQEFFRVRDHRQEVRALTVAELLREAKQFGRFARSRQPRKESPHRNFREGDPPGQEVDPPHTTHLLADFSDRVDVNVPFVPGLQRFARVAAVVVVLEGLDLHFCPRSTTNSRPFVGIPARLGVTSCLL